LKEKKVINSLYERGFMYTFELSKEFLSNKERAVFKKSLDHYHVDENIWEVFACFFDSEVKGTTPFLIKAYDNLQLCGAVILIKCSKFGRSLFNNRFMAGIINSLNMPSYMWIKFGCCMDMLSNPGFVVEPEKADEIHTAMAEFLKKNYLLTLIYDYSDKSYLYPNSTRLPAPPHALIDISHMKSVQDYTREHKNIKRKMNIFINNGGTFEIINNFLNKDTIDSLRKCFISTSEKSLFYLPYQDIYLNSALKTSNTQLDEVYYFIAKINGEFLGYQAALKTGSCLNALHGAFDRERKTNYHAYEILFVKMVEFAIENGLKSIDFGSVINVSKKRMVNKTLDMSYYLFGKYSFLQWIMGKLLKISKIQGKEQMQFNIEP
jgi:hypothetical protein